MTNLLSIKVENYRSLYNFKIEWQPFTMLIGRNDAGKSNLLNATCLLLNGTETAHIDRYDWSKAAKATRFPRKTAITAKLDGEKELIIRRLITIQKDAPATSVLEIQDGNTWRFLTEEEEKQVPKIYYFRPRTGALQEAFNPRQENNIFTLVKDWMPSALSEEKHLNKLMRGYARQETNLMAYVKFFENEVSPALKIAFPSDFLMQLHPDFRSPEDRGRLFVRELTHDTAKKALSRLPLDHRGSGLISVVAMVLSIAILQEYHRQVLNGKPLITAIEEPEVHLHPRAQQTFLSYLKWTSKRHQVIVATHSPIFVDRAQPENVVVLRRAIHQDEKEPKEKDKVIKPGTTLAITKDYRGNWKEVIETLGIRLSDALMAGEVNLLVEGPTEAILLPAMAEALINLGQEILSFDRVLVVIGEGGNLPRTATLLQSIGNPIVVLVDNDEGGNDIRKAMENKRQVQEDLVLNVISLPAIKTLSPPFNQLKKYEFEDLLDSKILLKAFNEAFAGIAGFEFLSLSYEEFDKEQAYLIETDKPFGWVNTIHSIIYNKNNSHAPRKKQKSARFSKRVLAEKAAQYIRSGEMPVPDFCRHLFSEIEQFIKL
jgi:predicted ATP-dependent endonuclease of OLD family